MSVDHTLKLFTVVLFSDNFFHIGVYSEYLLQGNFEVKAYDIFKVIYIGIEVFIVVRVDALHKLS